MYFTKPPHLIASLRDGYGALAGNVAFAAVRPPSRDPEESFIWGAQGGQRSPCMRAPFAACAARIRAVASRAAAIAMLAPALAILPAGPASAQAIANPPLPPHDVTVFPERDFMSMEGFAPNADMLVQVRRGGALVSDAIGRTNAEGALEVNHPGGVCWRNVTPDIVSGDLVRVTYRDTINNQNLPQPPVAGSGAALNTQNVMANQAFDADNGTVVVTGRAQLANGSRIPLNRLEVRIVNPDFRDIPQFQNERTIRATSPAEAGTPHTLAYDSTTGTAFTAVFRGLTEEQRLLAVEGQTRVMAWQQTTAAGDRLGLTIYEVGEFGGPGMGGCPPGPNGVATPANPAAPVHYEPLHLLDAALQANQGQLKDVTVFPERDFLSVEGFPAGVELQVVVRRGTSSTPVVGTARGIVGRSGVFEVNHPGGVCWTGQTPNIIPGDWIDVFQVSQGQFFAGQTQQVINTRVTRPAFINATAGDVRVLGTAVDAAGAPYPIRLMEQRIINPDFNDTRIDRRDIRADNSGGRIENVPGGTGSLVRVGTVGEWRAVYTGLNAAEQQLAVAGQSRAMAWLSTNGNGDRFGLTISEFGEVGGPGMGGCPPPGNAAIAIP